VRDVDYDAGFNFMKTLIFPVRVAAIAAVALLNHFTASAAEQPPVVSAASAVQISPNVAEVLKLTSARVGDEIVVAFVGSSKHTYVLGANEIVYLREQGVSDRVITAMLEQHKQAPETWTASTPPQNNNSAASASYIAQPSTSHIAAPSTTTSYVAPAYAQPPAVYAYPPAGSYYDSRCNWWGILPAISLSFGFGFGNGHGCHH
jgi:hypothetical protein